MTHGVVQSDIELTQKLIQAKCDDVAIVAALVYRGLDRQQARSLLNNLRRGGRVRPELPIRISRRSRRRRSSHRHHDYSDLLGGPGRPARHGDHHRPGRAARRAFRWTCAALALVVILTSFSYVGYATWQFAEENNAVCNDISPLWQQRLETWQKGLPDRGWDDLKNLPSKPD